MAGPDGRETIVDFYTDVVLPALAERLDAAFPEFGWRRDAHGWVATNEEMTHRALGARAARVVAHGPAPRGFLVHGAEPMLWTAYLNGGTPPRGEDFARVVKELAARAGVDAAPLERPVERDRRAELLSDFFALCQAELASERGAAARAYLERRGLPSAAIEGSGLGVVPDRARSTRALAEAGYSADEIRDAGLQADSRWAGRLVGAWRHERGKIGTLWARALDDGSDADARYLYLRGASRTGLPPYGLSDVVAQPISERGEVILVEGLIDVHHLRARGVTNVAALGGTGTRPEAFESLARLGFERVTLCLDRDQPGRTATARAVEHAARAKRSPSIFVVDPEHLAPAKDPDAFMRDHGVDEWGLLLEKVECGITWRAVQLLERAGPDGVPEVRREALGRAGSWLGSLPPRLALEQEDAIRDVAARCGYSPTAVERAFRARFWPEVRLDRGREPAAARAPDL
ncbi:MAG: toprim domain-containing protein [Candidatus Limnocylindria bacterium]